MPGRKPGKAVSETPSGKLPRNVWVTGWVSFCMDISSEMVYPRRGNGTLFRPCTKALQNPGWYIEHPCPPRGAYSYVLAY
jgi:hypothetical protein